MICNKCKKEKTREQMYYGFAKIKLTCYECHKKVKELEYKKTNKKNILQ